MRKNSSFFCVLILLAPAVFSASFQDRAAQELQKKLPENPRSSFHVSGERIYSLKPLVEFYEHREYKPAWSDEKGVTVSVIALLNTLQRADREGLNPADYHLERLSQLGAEITQDAREKKKIPVAKLVNLDLLLTDAFLTYGDHLLSGRVDPAAIDDEWRGRPRVGNLGQVLEEAFEKDDIRGMLKSLYPPQWYYSRLRIALDRYRAIEKNGGWEKIPMGKPLKKGDRDERIPALRERLVIEGDLKKEGKEPDLFDASLERAIYLFQKRHGIDPDGKLGQETLATLNVPVEERVNQLQVNLERCRWLPADLGDPHILVNVANYSLDVIQNAEPVLSMKVVVGRRYRHTPVFSSSVTTVVLNPYWTVPAKLARLDILEHIREEPDYLIKHKFKVYKGYDDGAVLVDPSTVDWASVDPKTSDYKFRQDPGVTNALGQIKFLFPNEFDVYLHDTPSRELFNKTKRDFSSGCIRIEKPIELAEFLLHINYGWDREKVMQNLKNKAEQFISLQSPVPVHLMYWTAWMDERGSVQFREDLYGRDLPLEKALHQAPGGL